jgi:hypothetical protein
MEPLMTPLSTALNPLAHNLVTPPTCSRSYPPSSHLQIPTLFVLPTLSRRTLHQTTINVKLCPWQRPPRIPTSASPQPKCEILAEMFRHCFLTIETDWKTATTILIHKKEDTSCLRSSPCSFQMPQTAYWNPPVLVLVPSGPTPAMPPRLSKSPSTSLLPAHPPSLLPIMPMKLPPKKCVVFYTT